MAMGVAGGEFRDAGGGVVVGVDGSEERDGEEDYGEQRGEDEHGVLIADSCF